MRPLSSWYLLIVCAAYRRERLVGIPCTIAAMMMTRFALEITMTRSNRSRRWGDGGDVERVRRLGLDRLLYTRDQGVDAVTKYFVVAGITGDVDVIVDSMTRRGSVWLYGTSRERGWGPNWSVSEERVSPDLLLTAWLGQRLNRIDLSFDRLRLQIIRLWAYSRRSNRMRINNSKAWALSCEVNVIVINHKIDWSNQFWILDWLFCWSLINWICRMRVMDQLKL